MKESASLFYNDLAAGGTSDKCYFITLQPSGSGYTVTAQYGRNGGTLATDDKTKDGPLPYEAAKKIYDRVLREKLAKGYRGSVVAAPAPQVEPAKRKAVASAAATGEPARPQVPSASELPCELLEEITEAEARRLIQNDGYFMQDKADGHRRQVSKTADGITGLNKKGVAVPLPANLHAQLARIPLKTFLLDGEIIGERLIVWDILNADGEDVAQAPYSLRFDVLTAAVAHCAPVVTGGARLVSLIPTWRTTAEKKAAFEQQRRERAEGVVFKQTAAPYRAGRNGQHKKFKFVKTLSAIVMSTRKDGKESAEIGLYFDGKLRKCGTVSLIGKPRVAAGDVVEIAYLYAYPGSGNLIQARLMVKRDDVDQVECTAAQLIYKRESEVA